MGEGGGRREGEMDSQDAHMLIFGCMLLSHLLLLSAWFGPFQAFGLGLWPKDIFLALPADSEE